MEQDVLWLDVPVNDTMAMRVVERRRDLLRDANCVIQWKLPFLVDALPQRPSLHRGHHVEQEAVGLAGVIQGEDVRVGQLGRDLDLPQESLRADLGGQVRPKHLERDAPVMALVLREKDDSHPALAQLASDRVATAQRRPQELNKVRHAHPNVHGASAQG